jgi:hypothetical protein
MKYFYSTLLVLFCIAFSNAQSLELQTKWWQPNGVVKTITTDTVKNIVYVGGSFDYIGPEQAFATQISIGEPNISTDIPLPNGAVFCSIPDDNGGWYIGGNFTKVGDSIRNYLAHISSTGVVTNWNPNADYLSIAPRINCLTKHNGIIYAGGNFTTIGGQARSRIAALDAITGLATSWNVNLTGDVNVIRIDKEIMYVGGESVINTSSIVAINIASATLTSWAPKINGRVYDIAVKNDTIIVGGWIEMFDYYYRNLFFFDAKSSNLIDWQPKVDGVIFSLAIKDDQLLIGGEFTNVNIGNATKSRKYLAKINLLNGELDDWNANVNDAVGRIIINNNDVFITGGFKEIGNQTRYRIGSVDFTTGVVTNWDFDADGLVNTVSFSENSIFIGGSFSSIGGQDRRLIAAMDLSSGKATDWNPAPYGESINSIAIYKDFVYVGGEFGYIGETSRNNLAELNSSSNYATDFDLSVFSATSASSVIYALTIKDDRLYIGGNFSGIGRLGDVNSSRIAVFNLLSKSLINSWLPNADGPVRCIAVDGNTVYIGGNFSNVGGQERKGIAALDATTGLATSWNPNYMNNEWHSNSTNNVINTIVVSLSTVFVAGQFYTIGNNSERRNIASVNKTTGLLTNWRPFFPSAIPRTMQLRNDKIYIGSYYIGGTTPLDVYDTISGAIITGYSNIINGEVYAFQFYHNQLFIGGQFTNSLGTPRIGLAVINSCTSAYTPIIEADNNIVCPYSKTFLSIKNADKATSWKWFANNCAGIPLAGSGDNIEVFPSANATTYYVKGSGGCVNTLCQSKTIYLKMPPFKPTVTINDNMLVTDEIMDGSFQWIDCETNSPILNEDAASYEPTVNGSYGVALTQFGCTSTSDCMPVTFLENPTNPTIASNHLSTIKIYPNPTNGAVVLDFGQQVQSGNVSVINSLGECVFSTIIENETSIHLNFDKQSSGLFVINIEKESGNESIKLIKQ